jgi:DHA1 family multidrug resistance protein-like MFS transporter
MTVASSHIPPAAEEHRWRTLWLMVAVQFTMSSAITVLSPILPLFLPEIGVESPEAVQLWAGLLTSVPFLLAAFASPLWGRLADQRGRKLMVLRSSAAICLFTALMGLSTDVWQLFTLRVLMGAFSGFSASAIALMATRTPEHRLGYALGWLSTGQLTGGLIGPVMGGILADLFGSYRIVFYVTSTAAALVVVLVWRLVPDVAPTSAPAGRGRGGRLGGFGVLFSSAGLLPLFLVLLMAQFGVRAVQPVVTLFVRELVGPIPALATFAGIAFSITGVANLIAAPFLGRRSDVIGYRRVLLIGLAGGALFSVPQAFANNFWVFVAERFGLGLFVGAILPTANALVGRSVEASQRGTAYGLTASATFLGSFLGPFTGGAVAALFGIRMVFLVTGAMFLANFLWVFLVVREPTGPEAVVSPDALAGSVSGDAG